MLCRCIWVYTCVHPVGISWLKYLSWQGNFQLEEEKEEGRWVYTTFRLEFAVCVICIWKTCIVLKIWVDASTCLQIIYVSLQGPNIPNFCIIFPPFFSPFPFSSCFLLIYFSKWTNAGHRFLIKMTTYPFPKHKVENLQWRTMTILVGCVMEGIWKIQCMALDFSIFADIFLYFNGQDLASKQNCWWRWLISFPEPFERLICRTEIEEDFSFWHIEFFFPVNSVMFFSSLWCEEKYLGM